MAKEPIIFYVSNYLTRQDLEADIKSRAGVDSKKNEEAEHEIRGTKKELKQKRLSDQTTIWGIKCISSYGSTQKDLRDKLKKRGKIWKE